MSYIRTHDGAEIDLGLERPGKGAALVEIKSAEKMGPVLCLPWQESLAALGLNLPKHMFLLGDETVIKAWVEEYLLPRFQG